MSVGRVGIRGVRSVAVLMVIALLAGLLGPVPSTPVEARSRAAARAAAEADAWGCGRPPRKDRPTPDRPKPSPDPDAGASPDPSPEPGPEASTDAGEEAPGRSPAPDPVTPEPETPRDPPKDPPKEKPADPPEDPPKDPPKDPPNDPPKDPPADPPAKDPAPEPQPDPQPDPKPDPQPDPPAPEPSAAAQAMLAADPEPVDPGHAIDPGVTARWLAWIIRSALPLVDPGPIPEIPAFLLPPDDAVPEVPPPARAVPRGWTRGLDISHWNGAVDLGAVRDAGYAFVIAKATQGTGFIDPLFVRNVAAVREAGLTLGAYHFFDYRVPGAAQAQHFLATLAAEGVLDDALPPVVDVECFKLFGPAKHATARRELRAFSDTIFAATGRLPMIYTSGHMWHEIMDDDPSFGDHPLWVACWRCDQPGLPAGWDTWAVWQIGSMAVPGRSGRLDGNVLPPGRGTLARLAAPVLTVASETRAERVSVAVRAQPGTRLRVAVDAGPWSGWRRAGTRLVVPLGTREGRHQIRVQLRSPHGRLGPVHRLAVRVARVDARARPAAEAPPELAATPAIRPHDPGVAGCPSHGTMRSC